MPFHIRIACSTSKLFSAPEEQAYIQDEFIAYLMSIMGGKKKRTLTRSEGSAEGSAEGNSAASIEDTAEVIGAVGQQAAEELNQIVENVEEEMSEMSKCQ